MIEICHFDEGSRMAAEQLAERMGGEVSLNFLQSFKEITEPISAGNKRLALLKYFEDSLNLGTLRLIEENNLHIVAAERVPSVKAITGNADYLVVSAKPVEKIFVKSGGGAKKCTAMVSISNIQSPHISETFRKISGIELNYERLIYEKERLYLEVSGNCGLLYDAKLLKHFFPKAKILGFYEVPA